MDRRAHGGIFLTRPRRSLRVFRFIPVIHDLGLWFVYASALGAWTYVVGSNALKLVGRPMPYGGLTAAVITTLAFMLGLAALDEDVDAAYRRNRGWE